MQWTKSKSNVLKPIQLINLLSPLLRKKVIIIQGHPLRSNMVRILDAKSCDPDWPMNLLLC